MKNQVFTLPEKEVGEKAASQFVKACGFDETKAKHGKMRRQAEALLEQGRSTLRPMAIVSSFPGQVIQQDRAVLEEIPFVCKAFTRMDQGQVEWLYAYILTVGEVSVNEDNVLEQLYADIWGTAYADAAVEVLAELLKADAEARAGGPLVINPSFGPGFYGMEVDTIPDFFRLLDGGSIGVQVSASGFMVPQKSCAGFFITAKDSALLPPGDCLNCLGNVSSCRLCRNYAG